MYYRKLLIISLVFNVLLPLFMVFMSQPENKYTYVTSLIISGIVLLFLILKLINEDLDNNIKNIEKKLKPETNPRLIYNKERTDLFTIITIDPDVYEELYFQADTYGLPMGEYVLSLLKRQTNLVKSVRSYLPTKIDHENLHKTMGD